MFSDAPFDALAAYLHVHSVVTSRLYTVYWAIFQKRIEFRTIGGSPEPSCHV